MPFSYISCLLLVHITGSNTSDNSMIIINLSEIIIPRPLLRAPFQARSIVVPRLFVTQDAPAAAGVIRAVAAHLIRWVYVYPRYTAHSSISHIFIHN